MNGLIASISHFVPPRQIVKRRRTFLRPILILQNFELLAVTVFDAGAMLIDPAISNSIDVLRRHTAKVAAFCFSLHHF